MGKRRRERKLAIMAGTARSYRDTRKDMLRLVTKYAAPGLFADRSLDDHLVENWIKDFGDIWASEITRSAIVKALFELRITTFRVGDIHSDKSFKRAFANLFLGMLATEPKIRFTGKGAWWIIRKRKGRKRKGEWRFCEWDGTPFYAPPSSRQRFYSHDNYWNAYRWERDVRPIIRNQEVLT